MHAPFEVRIGGDGDYALDMDGASSWGWHSMNCTPSGMQGAIWVQFTQTLICNDKVNDGAYLAIETNFPEGTIANLGDAEGSTGIAWAFLQPAFTGFPRTLSRALQARGFIEEVIAPYSTSGNVIQGGGIDQYGNSSAIMNFEIAAQGMGGKYVLDGTDTCAAMFNPEGDAGDVEMWELICPMTYLSRRIKANTGGAGRHRGGSSFESLLVVHGTEFWELQNLGSTRILASGLFGGYPGSASYVHNIKGADLIERAQRGEAYPLCDGSFDDPALMGIEGERTYKQDNFTTLEPFAEGDLYLSVMKGGPGLGDPLLRPVEQVERDVEEGHLLPRFAESIYGVSDRDAYRRRRLERGQPAREWWATERERVLAGDFIDAVKAGYAESMKLSERFAAEFRGFWDLPEDFTFAIATPTVPAEVTEKPGKITPEESADAYLAASQVDSVEMPRAAGGTLDRETLAAMLDEKLTRREVKDIQSGYKDPDRFEKWLAVLQERVQYDDPIVLPMGEGLNAVETRTGTWSYAATAATTSARRTGTGGWRRSCSCATTRRRWARSIRASRGPIPSGRSCASSTARPAPGSSRSRPCRRATRCSTSSCPTSRASTGAGWGARSPDYRAGGSMLITTMNDLPGYRIDEVLGEVFGLTVRSRNIGSQIGAGLKSLAGGE